MYGSYEEKFAQCRAMFLYMTAHPGKKLNFMGNEIGQFREWAEYRPQDFDVLEQFPMHRSFTRFFRDMSHIYLSHPALFQGEYDHDCFRYVDENTGRDLVYGFLRSAGGERILAVFNFGNIDFPHYMVRVEGNHKLQELLNTEWDIYGGSKPCHNEEIWVRNGQCIMSLAPFSARIFRVE
jgi:1,4-alpha-glucan branching enzyme